MKARRFSLVLLTILACLSTLACTQAAPPAPTAAPKAAEPTKAAQPAAQPAVPTAAQVAAPTAVPPAPTAAPAKVAFPEKGKYMTWIVGGPAGGLLDIPARLLAGEMEKDLGVPVQVVNKAGASGQISYTDLAKSKPDGYTIGTIKYPDFEAIIQDGVERGVVYSRKDFQFLAGHIYDPGTLVVKADSPYKTLKDLIDAAKAKPGKITVSGTGVLGDDHIALLLFQKAAGIQFNITQYEGSPQALNGLLGDHIDVDCDNAGGFLSQYKSGLVRILGVMDKQRSKYYPDVPTFEEQGVKLYNGAMRGIGMPAGAPKEVVDTLANSIKKGMLTPEHQAKLDEAAMPVRYMSPAEFDAYADAAVADVKSILEEAKKK